MKQHDCNFNEHGRKLAMCYMASIQFRALALHLCSSRHNTAESDIRNMKELRIVFFQRNQVVEHRILLTSNVIHNLSIRPSRHVKKTWKYCLMLEKLSNIKPWPTNSADHVKSACTEKNARRTLKQH